jgi:hypothetical protein
VIDPRQLGAGATRFRHDGPPVDAIWNKINTVGWRGHRVNLFQGGTKLAVFQEDAAVAS